MPNIISLLGIPTFNSSVAMFRDLQEKEQQSGVEYVSFAQKLPKLVKKPKTRKRNPKKKLEKVPA